MLLSSDRYRTMPLSIAETVLLAAGFARAAVATTGVPVGAIVLPLTYNEFTAAYYAPFEVGTPPQTEYLKVDTGSPTISFLDPQSSFCQQSSHPCMTYGTFDNETSSYVFGRFCSSLACILTWRDSVLVNIKVLASRMNLRTLVLVSI